uniref:Uncharacterized protein n=1 Tax=Geospiza parvula TaxID=87175 RepID=A0A8U8CDL7_GEOPR
MEEPGIPTEARLYRRNSDPSEYLKEFHSMGSSRAGASAFAMQNLRTLQGMFCPGEGDTLRDGCGPTMHQLLPACEHFQEIITGAFHWEPVVKYVWELEGDSEKWAEKQEKLRKKVKQKNLQTNSPNNPGDPPCPTATPGLFPAPQAHWGLNPHPGLPG